jgi:hypothetical protein
MLRRPEHSKIEVVAPKEEEEEEECPSSAEVMNEWLYTSTSSHVLMALRLPYHYCGSLETAVCHV